MVRASTLPKRSRLSIASNPRELEDHDARVSRSTRHETHAWKQWYTYDSRIGRGQVGEKEEERGRVEERMRTRDRDARIMATLCYLFLSLSLSLFFEAGGLLTSLVTYATRCAHMSPRWLSATSETRLLATRALR